MAVLRRNFVQVVMVVIGRWTSFNITSLSQDYTQGQLLTRFMKVKLHVVKKRQKYSINTLEFINNIINKITSAKDSSEFK